MTILENSTILALQAVFEALNSIAVTLPKRDREHVEECSKRVARAKAAIMATMLE